MDSRPLPLFLTFSHPAHCGLCHTCGPGKYGSVEKFNTFKLNCVFFRRGLGPIPLGPPTKQMAPMSESTLNFANVIVWMLQRRLDDCQPGVGGDRLWGECVFCWFHCAVPDGFLRKCIRGGNELWGDFDRRPTLRHPVREGDREVGPQENLDDLRWEIRADRRDENG